MSKDSDLRRQVARLADELARTQTEVATLRRGRRRPQLGDSSIDSGALEVRDPETGATRLRLGYQPDGTVGVVPEGGDPHPAPEVPVVEPIPSGLSVSWNGTLDGLEDLPSDFDHVNVHVSQVDGFTPTVGTFVGTITRNGGALPVAPLEVGETYYVRLIPVGTGGVQGAPSPQSSGVPAPVGGVPGPGSITETEIADDAISTPKLQAEAVTALKIAAQAIEAGHIQAAAITAAKLEAELVLGTRIIAGNPAGARVELDENGLRGYDEGDALVFAITDTGDAVFSGDIVASEISGSRILLDTISGTGGVIEQFPDEGVVRSQVTAASRSRAQIQASPGQAEFSVWGDHANPQTPAGGVIAQPGAAHLALYSDLSQTSSAPSMSLSVVSDSATGVWRASSEAEVRIRALGASASILLAPPAASDPDDRQGPGYIFANRSTSGEIAAVSLQSPRWEEPGGPEYRLRSVVFAEGANANRAHTRIVQAARRVLIMGEAAEGVYDTTSDGMLDLADTHSLHALRHQPVQTSFSSQPGFGTTGSFVDFTSGQWAPISFRTSWSGWTRITIQTAGINHQANGSSLATGFRLSGGGTVPASLARCAYIRSRGSGVSEPIASTAVHYLQLAGNADYTLTPAWRISGGSSSTASYYTTLDNTFTVEPLT